MTNFIIYLAEANVVFILLYIAYWMFFEKDRNFTVRRIYLLAIMLFSFLLPLIPEAIRIKASHLAPLSISLDEITVYASNPVNPASGSGLSFAGYLVRIYLAVVGFCAIRLLFQLIGIWLAVRQSDRIDLEGKTVLSHTKFPASSFFNIVFLSPDSVSIDSARHILLHEQVHQKQLHSLDRLMVELFAMVNWFNPLSWIYRNSVIRNLEYLADSGVMHQGIDRKSYQLSMISQYIGSASVTNPFSKQIKKRIHMLNLKYKTGSSWKIAMIVPLIFIALVAISCGEKEKGEPVYSVSEPDQTDGSGVSINHEDLFYEVDEMPTFQGGEPIAFRKYIAENLRYPSEAIQHGVTGKVYIKFVVSSTGKVVIPDQDILAKQEGKPVGEVVVVGYRTLNEDDPMPEEKYIQMLKDEVIRVVSQSPDWEPGKRDGKPANVLFTFPVKFALQ